MHTASEILKTALAPTAKTIQSTTTLDAQITKASDLMVDCLTNGKKILACGNGGSAADAADFCTELACRVVDVRRPYPSINLSQGGSFLTATGNDYGFEEIFARQVRAFGNSGDALIAI